MSLRREASLLDEGDRRMRGDGPVQSATDPREAQVAFDEEAAAIELARFHVAQVELERFALRWITGLTFRGGVVSFR